MKATLYSLLFFFLSVKSFSQILYFEEDFIPENCYCKSYSIQGPDSNVYRKYTADSLGKIIVRNIDRYNTIFDSIYYDSKGQIIQTTTFLYEPDRPIPLTRTITYTYSPSGKILMQKEFINNILNVRNEYDWDEKDRPVGFKTAHFDVMNPPLASDSSNIKYTYTNDTTAMLQFYYLQRMIATSKQVYNKKYKIVRETLESVRYGHKVQFVWKYYPNGALKSIQKTQGFAYYINLHNSAHYSILGNLTRKISFEYDSTGRIITKKIYLAAPVDKEYVYRYVYQ